MTRGGSNKLVAIVRKLARDVNKLVFSEPVRFVYNPLDYAWAAQKLYLERYGQGKKEALFLGMNPGPFGMAQTGVPFGEIASVRNWLGIEAKINKPEHEHPKRPIEGFACKRSEVSGRRLWSWASERFGSAEQFFKRFFVHNFCPLIFLEESGKNRTPDKLLSEERKDLFELCDNALAQIVELMQPQLVIGIGAFAEKRARIALEGMTVDFGRLLHPSPASPLANRGWAEQADRALAAMGVGKGKGG